jgi:hypothetical protein
LAPKLAAGEDCDAALWTQLETRDFNDADSRRFGFGSCALFEPFFQFSQRAGATPLLHPALTFTANENYLAFPWFWIETERILGFTHRGIIHLFDK